MTDLANQGIRTDANGIVREWAMPTSREVLAEIDRKLKPLQQVAVSEQPWRRPGWCDTQGQCWMGDPGGAESIAAWIFCVPEVARSMSVSLPADALPLPKLPSDPVAKELTDEQLLQMAAKATGHEAIAPGPGEFEGHGTAVKVYGSELIAYGRAVIAAVLGLAGGAHQ